MIFQKIKRLPTFIKIGYVIIFFLGLTYLWWPVNDIPNLGKKYSPTGIDSADLLGMPKGIYFTNKTKSEAYLFYQNNLALKGLGFSCSPTEWHTKLTQKIINDTAFENTSFLTSFGCPMKKNLLIRGFGETDKDATAKKLPEKIIRFSPEEKKEYSLRLAIYPLAPHPLVQFIVWLAIWLTTPLVISQIWAGGKKINDYRLKK